MEAEAQTRVLLVDDDPTLVRIYLRALEAAGFSVETATDGLEGLNRLLVGSYDVVVSDVCMPRMNGLRLLDSVRRMRPDVPVVLMTAELDPLAYEKAKELGSVRYLIKPFSLDQLAREVRRATQLRAVWRKMSARRQTSS
jgi:DNA-binding NtrC family response regulator